MRPIALLCCLSFILTLSAQNKIFVKDYGIQANTFDATRGVIEALEACKDLENSELIFEKGIYNFYPEKGIDKYCFISNNDEGLKRLIFLIDGFKKLTIDGQGATFIFHGFINPFVIENSSQITFKNFTVDFKRSFHSEAIILANHKDGVDIEIPKQFPFRLKNNILLFTGNDKKDVNLTRGYKDIIYLYRSLLEFDTQKRETAFMARDYYTQGAPLAAKSLGGRKVRIFFEGLKGTVGNTLVFGSANRNYPAFILSDSKDLKFKNITIHHAGGMGIVGQRVENVIVDSCTVSPSQNRMISTTADATHFTNCTGKIELSNCTFMNQMDDATNIHGIYVQITEQISPNEVIVQLKHAQQFGFDFLKKGVQVEFVKGKSLITKGTAEVITVERINKEFSRVILSEKLPDDIKVGDVIGQLYNYAEIHIHNNYIGKNRARGMLLNCSGKTIVENNVFHSPGAAILFEGDANFWFEQGGVRDCIIRNNVFDNCMFGVWGKAVIGVAAGITENKNESRYNKNIKIYGNTFKIFDKVHLLHAYSVGGIEWKDNKIEYGNQYPSKRNNPSFFDIEYCDSVNIEQ